MYSDLFGDPRQHSCAFSALKSGIGAATTSSISCSQQQALIRQRSLLRISSLCIALLVTTIGIGAAQQPGRGAEANMALARAAHTMACGVAGSGGAVTMHAPQTHGLTLCEGRALAAGAALSGPAQPLALASADFDEDGVPDLVSAFATGKTGVLTVHRGNVDALWPYGRALRNGPPPAFLPGARSFTVPEAPSFVITGDFDADGHWDIATARMGSDAIYLLRGDGHGVFRAAERIPAGGSITAMIVGEINKRDGLTDIVVGVQTAGGSMVQVYESPLGALNSQPEVIKMPAKVSALALGKFDGTPMHDLAVAAGEQLVMVHGRDRKLTLSQAERAAVGTAKVTGENVGFAIEALAAGDFTGGGPSLAALGSDGKVHLLEHALAQNSVLGKLLEDPNYEPAMRIGHAGSDDKNEAISGTMTPGKAAQMAAIHGRARADSESEWAERGVVALPSGFSQTMPRLIAGRVSGSQREDLLIADSGNSRLHVLSVPRTPRAGSMNAAVAKESNASMRVLASLEGASAPAAVLPMRLNQHGLSGLVVLQNGQSTPSLVPQDIPAANVFTVTNTSDKILGTDKPTQYTGPAGSLRAAMFNANNTDGTSEIVFNIPTTDPGYNPTTGSFLIQPLSESVPGSFNNFALPPVDATMTIDGYTQPGASPNTLANGDNAKILIQIDGSKATTPGGSGFVPFDDIGSIFRGLDFTGWVSPAISGGTASGAEGIEANGVGDFIEGNFFGTDTTGKTAAPNRIGVFADNGPLFGSAPGNIIGGTTPQARNILSGNNNSGVLFLSTAYEAQLQGNFIGLDVTGTAIVSNPQEADRSNTFDGAGLNGPTVTIGGTLPGSTNVIAGNGTNVDINDLTEGGAASDSLVQGNLIGTDATGTHAIANQGYGISILHNPTNMTIGGTSAAARNVISGNLAGVYIFDNAFYNVVQGNYIGTDITGTKAVANVQQGFISGATSSNSIPAGYTTIGGMTAGAGNVISGNTMDGILISGTSQSQSYPNPEVGNTIQGNLIGVDVTGKVAIPNQGNGLNLGSNATNNLIGGTEPGSGNMISNNKGHGILIDPQSTAGGIGVGNNTIANSIQSNGGAGVRINSGSSNRISQNSIYGNKALGIDLATAGPNAASHCNATNDGANLMQNAPSLTAGSGSLYISATATDPNGNTSEFSNAVKSSASGDVISLLGNFDSVANTSYTIEFFSNAAPDASGFGQGQTYLTSTTVTTGADCTTNISDPVDTTKADISVSLTSNSPVFEVGPDFGGYYFTGTVANAGPATAHNVVFTDTLPAGLEISSAYCNTGPCQTPATSTLGNCTVSGQKVTCNLGTMAPGATAVLTLPVQITVAGSLSDTATVTATESDPKLANNTATLGESSDYPSPFVDHLSPASAVTISSGSLPLTVYGNGFLPTSAVSVNGTAVTTTGYFDNQVCGGPFQPGFCSAIQVSVPASLLNSAGTATVLVTNPDPGPGGEENEPFSAPLTLVSSCTVTPQFFGFNPVDAEGDTLIAEEISVTANAPTCPWTAASNASWLTILDNSKGNGNGSIDVAVAPNTGAARSGTVTVAGKTVEIDQEAGDASICSYALNPVSAHIPAAGSSGSFAVTTISSCSYFVESYPQEANSFITIPETSGLLVGNGSPSYTVAANHGAPRTGSIMVGGDVFAISQDAPGCYYTLDSSSAMIPVAGGTGTIGVTASSPSCAWTAKSSNSSQVSITAGASGTGNGTVKYSVPLNTGGPETPTITIGDANGYSIYSITQASSFTCTFTISPSPKSVGSNGTTDFFTLTASYNFCKWTANSSDPTALSITGATSGTGTSAVYYAVGQNATGKARTLTITAGCETFTVNQDGALSSNPAPSITSLLPASATARSGAFTLTVNGSGFISSSTVNFNGKAEATTYGNATQVTAAIPAADIASAGVVPVTVTNPTPGGGSSNAVNFTISSGSGPAGVLSPTTIAFPNTSAGSKSAVQNVTLTNTGSSALTITGISITGTNAADFNETNTCGSSLASGANCTIAMTFAPASAASFSATLSVADNATGSPQTVALTGTGTATAAPTASLSPTSLSFRAQSGTVSAGQTITLSNTGNTVLTISSIALSGSGASSFVASNTCGSSLAAGSSCLIAVVFSPTATGNFSATLSVADNATGSPQTAALTGTSTSEPAPAASLTPASLSFSAQTETTSASQSATLKNTGNAPLTISGITISGSGSVDFAETTTCGSSLNAGASCSLSVIFTPAAVGSFSATLSIADNATGSPQTVTLAGTGTAPPTPIYTVSSSTNAQTVQAGGTAQYSITVAAKNGAYPNAVTLAASGLPAGATASFSPASITPGSSSATSVLSVQTAGAPTAAGTGSHLPLALASLPGFAFLLLAVRRRKRWMAFVILLLASAGAMTALTGCGGGFALPGSRAKTYSITVTGTSGSDSASTTVQLIVQ